MLDVMTEMHDLRASILRAYASRLCLSDVVVSCNKYNSVIFFLVQILFCCCCYADFGYNRLPKSKPEIFGYPNFRV
jgi:hypothetical protein